MKKVRHIYIKIVIDSHIYFGCVMMIKRKKKYQHQS